MPFVLSAVNPLRGINSTRTAWHLSKSKNTGRAGPDRSGRCSSLLMTNLMSLSSGSPMTCRCVIEATLVLPVARIPSSAWISYSSASGPSRVSIAARSHLSDAIASSDHGDLLQAAMQAVMHLNHFQTGTSTVLLDAVASSLSDVTNPASTKVVGNELAGREWLTVHESL